MKITLPWREKRLFVALGEHSVALACMVNGWRSWHVQAQQVVSLKDEVSASALAGILRAFMGAQGLTSGCAVHWFLPPDILAVALVPQDIATLDTQWLPYNPQALALGVVAGNQHFTSALWIHRNWQDVFRAATEQVGGQVLYLHPRALYVTTLFETEIIKKGSDHPIKILREGRDWHVFHNRHGLLRSVTQAVSLSPEQAQARIGLELKQLFDLLELSPAGVLTAQQHLLPTAVHDVAQLLSRTTGPVKGEWRLSSAQLHACGLLVGRLTAWVERRLQVVTAGLMLLFTLGGAVAWQHDQSLQKEQREMSTQLKTLLPVVEDVQQLKKQTTLQGQVLSVHEAVQRTPYDWQILAGVLAHVPKGVAVGSVWLDHQELRVELIYSTAKAVLTSWAIPQAQHLPLAEVPDSRVAENKTVRVTYAVRLNDVPSSSASTATHTTTKKGEP